MTQNLDIKNPNHPTKGSKTEVDPIRNEKDIKSIKQFLESYPRDYLLFVLGINNGIRVGDLLKLRVGDLRYLKPGQVHQIRESKTGKKNIIVVNKSVRKALDKYIAANRLRAIGSYCEKTASTFFDAIMETALQNVGLLEKRKFASNY